MVTEEGLWGNPVNTTLSNQELVKNVPEESAALTKKMRHWTTIHRFQLSFQNHWPKQPHALMELGTSHALKSTTLTCSSACLLSNGSPWVKSDPLDTWRRLHHLWTTVPWPHPAHNRDKEMLGSHGEGGSSTRETLNVTLHSLPCPRRLWECKGHCGWERRNVWFVVWLGLCSLHEWRLESINELPQRKRKV